MSMKQAALFGNVGRNVGGVSHRVFVADDGAESRDQVGRKRGYCGPNDIHPKSLWADLASCASLAPPHRGATQPVVDRLAKPVMRHRHDRDGARALGIERTKITEKIGGGFREIA